MTAQITEVLMGLGSFDFSFKHDADLVDLPSAYEHAIVYEGEDLILTGVILKTKPGPLAAVGGAGVDWWLGKDSDGPIIEDREYIAGSNKLSNGDFDDGDLLWRGDEDPLWVIAAGVASIVGTPTKHERLESNESFEAEPGQLYRATATCARSGGTIGRLRMRLVFHGRFRWPNLVTGLTWADVSAHAGDATVGVDDFVVGPVTERQSIENASFEGSPDLTHWYDQDPTAFVVDSSDLGGVHIFQGAKAVVAASPLVGGHALLYDDDAAATPPIEPISVVPGEKWFLQGAITPWAAGAAGPHADGRAYFGVLFVDDAGGAHPVFFATDVLGIDDVPSPGWTLISVQGEVPDDHFAAHPFIQVYDVTTGAWAFDAFTFTHQEQNKAAVASSEFAVTAERTYRLLASVRSDEGVSGNLKASVTFYGAPDGRDPVTIESAAQGPTDGEEKLFSFDFVPPSGYTTASVAWVGVDVDSGSFRIRRNSISVIDTDETTKPVDAVSVALPVGTVDVTVDVTAPEGTERVHAELVVEADGAGWSVSNVDVHRRETPDLAEAIVDDFLRDPDTGEYILLPGTIHAAGVIAHDWRIRNTHDRDSLLQLSQGGLLADRREWNVTPDATVDWGLPEEIFTDRTDFVLTADDLILRRKPDTVADVGSRPSRVKLIGADRTPVAGQRQLITGEADVALDGVDLQGNPINRTRIVEDSTVDTAAYADGRAELELAKTAGSVDSTTFDLADWRTAGTFDVGDTIYAYVPEAGLIDAANEGELDGRPVWPVGRRVVSRTRKLGPGYRLEIRAGDGTTRDVTDLVDWEQETSASVTFGAARPDFVLDPQGGAAGRQFRRYRASTPR